MKRLNQLLFFLFIFIAILITGCSSGNHIGGSGKQCGCGLNKGMVGY